MHPVQWQAFIAQFSQLSQRQRLAGIALLQDGAAQNAAIALVEQTAQASLHCPSCGATHIHRHGHAHGQRAGTGAAAGGMAAEVDAALAKLGRTRRIAVRLPHWTVAPALLKGTDLILTVAQRAVQGCEQQGVMVHAPPFAIAPFSFELVRHYRTDGDAGIAWLRAAIAAAVS